MSKFEYKGTSKVIELNNKFFGHNIVDGDYGLERVWHDEIKHAILWRSDKEIPLDKISCPAEMREELLTSNVIEVKIKKIFEI